jgi:MscS family membrane protein
VINRFSSVVVWILGTLIVCDMISAFLHVPLKSTLAFGGFGGIAVGFSARDIVANFLGGKRE